MNRQQRRLEARKASAKPQMPIRAATLQTLFDTALSHHQAGRLADAELLYAQILAAAPRHADAMHLLGVIACQTGQPGIAAEKIANAIRIDGSKAFYYANLGDALRQLYRFGEAEAACRKAIELAPDFAEAHSNLGAALYELGRFAEAGDAWKNAIHYNPNLASAHINLGKALLRQNRHEEAATAYFSAIGIHPNLPEAHVNLAAILDTLGRFEAAAAAYASAIRINPNDHASHLNLGNALNRLGHADQALAAYARAIQLRPDYAEAHSNTGAVLENLGRFQEAITACNTAIGLKPDYAEAHSNLGNALYRLGRLDEALVAYERAVGLKPEDANCRSNLAAVLSGLGHFEEALAVCETALKREPDHVEANSNLGIALERLGRFEEAYAAYNKAIRLKPDYAEAYSNLGVLLHGLGRSAQAVAASQTAIALKPDMAESHFNLGVAYLKMGSFKEGWEKYEWRWKSKQMRDGQRHFEKPLWDGQEARAKTILIHAEQGFGDSLQFCRYAPLAAARGLRVILEVQKPLVRLLRTLPGVDQIIGQGDALPPFDVHAPMMSLPRALGTTVETIPGQTPYLHADETAIAAWRQRLSAIAGQTPKIGLLWAGNPRAHSPESMAIDRRRSIAPGLLAPLFDSQGAKFFSLQKDGPAPPAEFPIIDFMGEMGDFADTAALIANLDLVISVDSAVAHLAAALDKPVWLLNRFDSCWRWLTGRRDSPWYPNLRLYTQPQPGDWTPVIAEIAADLIQFQQSARSRAS